MGYPGRNMPTSWKCFLSAVATAVGLGVCAAPASACGWVYYEGFQANSAERVAIDAALTAKKWELARTLLLREKARAENDRAAKARNADEDGPWLWVGQGWFYYQLATAEFHLGNIDAAAHHVAAALDAKRRWDPDPLQYSQVFLLYGNIEFRKKNLKRAIQMVRRAASRNQRDARLWSTLATYQEAAGRLREAEASMERALRLSPKHHGGMEWVHLEVIRFRRQLKADPESHKAKPFLSRFKGRKHPAELVQARAFAKRLAPALPL